MFVIALLLLAASLSSLEAYSPARLSQWNVGDVFSEEKTMTEKVWQADRKRLADHTSRVRAETKVGTQDIKNAKGNPVVLNPKLFNIFRGNTWTTTQKDLVDNVAKNVGASPYGAILSTYFNAAGTKISPIQFVNSVQDSSEAPGQTGIDPSQDDQDYYWVRDQFQKYVTAKQIATAGDFDLKNFDMANTIFTLFLASGYNFATRPSFCGWHMTIPVKYNGVDTQMLVSLVLQGSAGVAFNCNAFGSDRGIGQINKNGVTIGPTSPNNDQYLDTAIGIYLHEIYEAATDPVFFLSWYDYDDDHYTANAPTFSEKNGGNNENADLCGWTFGMDTSQQYLTTNTPRWPDPSFFSANYAYWPIHPMTTIP